MCALAREVFIGSPGSLARGILFGNFSPGKGMLFGNFGQRNVKLH